MSDQSLAHMFFSDSYETATSRFTTLAEAANARRLSAPIPQSDHAIELALLGDVRATTLIIHFSTGQILTHFKMDICERLSHRMHHSTAMTT